MNILLSTVKNFSLQQQKSRTSSLREELEALQKKILSMIEPSLFCPMPLVIFIVVQVNIITWMAAKKEWFIIMDIICSHQYTERRITSA